jgi:hypothetical protein
MVKAMGQRWRFWVLIGLLIVVAVFVGDWVVAQVRLGHMQIDARAEPPVVVADGKNATTLAIAVTEDGQPCVNYLLQLYFSTGAGLLVPSWVYTDDKGTARVVYTPNPYSPYDANDTVLINVMDTSVGRLIEVDKRQEVNITLQAAAN